MLVMGSDILVYGNSYTEIQWNEKVTKQEQMYEVNGSHYTKADLKASNIPLKSTKISYITGSDGNRKKFIANVVEKLPNADSIVGLKDLDPLYMRVRRDSYGNQYGYIQWLDFPPSLVP